MRITLVIEWEIARLRFVQAKSRNAVSFVIRALESPVLVVSLILAGGLGCSSGAAEDESNAQRDLCLGEHWNSPAVLCLPPNRSRQAEFYSDQFHRVHALEF
jgi:hypothetical protein